jgi:hypothetical protein
VLQFQTVCTLFPFLAACGLPILRTLHASIKPNNTLQPACETPTPCATLTWPSQPRLSVGSPNAMVFGQFNKCNMRPAHTAPATGGFRVRPDPSARDEPRRWLESTHAYWCGQLLPQKVGCWVNNYHISHHTPTVLWGVENTRLAAQTCRAAAPSHPCYTSSSAAQHAQAQGLTISGGLQYNATVH